MLLATCNQYTPASNTAPMQPGVLLVAVLLLLSGAPVRSVPAHGPIVTQENLHQHFFVRRAGHADWTAVHKDESHTLMHLEHNVVVFDARPCFWAAAAAYGSKHGTTLTPDPRHTTGGEIVHCRKLLHLLHRMHRTVTVVSDYFMLLNFTTEAVAAGKPPVTIRHFGAENGTKPHKGMNVLMPPFAEPCALLLQFYGGDIKDPQRGPVSLSNASKIISSYPYGNTTAIGFYRPAACPYVPDKRPFNRSYIFAYGKADTEMFWLDMVLPQFKNSTLWEALIAKHAVVFVRCPSGLPGALSIDGERWKRWVAKGEIICLDALPEPVPYSTLLAYAEFIMGLGLPWHSPTPLEALYCQTSVLVTNYQHWYVKATTWPPHAYDPGSARDVLHAMHEIEAKCKVIFTREADGRARKTNSCFEGHALSALEVYDEHKHLRDLTNTIEYVESECAKTANMQGRQ